MWNDQLMILKSQNVFSLRYDYSINHSFDTKTKTPYHGTMITGNGARSIRWG
jgi:hypothetical protein